MHLIKTIGIMWTLLTSLNWNDAFIIHYSQQLHNVTIPLEEEGYISCTCEGQIIAGDVPKDSLEKIFDSIRNKSFCSGNFESEVCNLLKECSNCTAEVKKCTPKPNTKMQFECFTRRLEKNKRFVMKLDPEKALDLFGMGRKSRKVNTCSYPKGLMTADLICHKYRDSVLCKQKCLFGYTLNEGVTREMSCVHSENVWKPVGFEECRQFIDCSVNLLHEGEMNCFTGTDEKFVYCNISCAGDKDKPRVPDGLYRCEMDGIWSPKLPFCVTSGSG